MKKTLEVLLHVTLFLCAIAIIVAPHVYNSMVQDNIYELSLNTEWTVKLNNSETYTDVNLIDFHMPVTEKGTYIEYERDIPNLIVSDPAMAIYSIHSVVHVYVDDELIFSLGEEEHKENKFIGYGHSFFDLPKDSEGKRLKITMLVEEDNAFSTLTPPVIYNSSTAIRDYVTKRFTNLFVALGLIAAGSCITIIAFFAYFRMHEMDKLFGIGVFSLCIGCWSLCNNDLALMFSVEMGAKSYMEYVSLYLVMFPLLLYFQNDVERRNNKIEKVIYNVLLTIQVLWFFTILTLQRYNVVHFSFFVKWYQMFLMIAGAFIAYILVSELIKNKRHKILFWGFAGMLAIATRDLIMFNVVKYLDNAGEIESNFRSYIGLGSLIFVTSMLTDFVAEMRAVMYKTAENEVYVKLAYNDALTGLYTRRKCNEIIAEMVESGKEYSIVLFDLNGLKNANDNYGHLQGDDLIVRFANILKKVYKDGEIICRLGGDEFTVVAPKKPGYLIKEREAFLREEIAKDNLNHRDIKVSVSMGYALSSEVEGSNPNDVMKLADKRMYADKERFYKETGLNRRRTDGE